MPRKVPVVVLDRKIPIAVLGQVVLAAVPVDRAAPEWVVEEEAENKECGLFVVPYYKFLNMYLKNY